MPDIIRARTRREFKQFFDFSETCGYSKDEAAYLEKYASPVLNPIRTDKREYLYAIKNGTVIGRLLTWKDDAYIKVTGDNCGFFALCDALNEESAQLIWEMIKLQKLWGTACVKGPVAPDGSGFFGGLCRGETKGIFNNPPAKINLPQICGFEILDEMKSFSISLHEAKNVEKLAEASMQRFSLKVERLSRGLFGDKLTECVYELAQKHEYARQAERIAAYVDRRYSFGVYSGGSCRGYILVLKGLVPRVATLVTAEGSFSAAAAAVLLAEVKKALERDGISEAEVGVIDPANSGSMLLTRYANARPLNSYATYFCEIK